MNPVNPCSVNFRSNISSCTGEAIAYAGLTANTVYTVVLADNWGNKFYHDYTSDVNGHITIDFADFTIVPGIYILEFTTDINEESETLTICGSEYTGIEITFSNTESPAEFCEQIGCKGTEMIVLSGVFLCQGGLGGTVRINYSISLGSGIQHVQKLSGGNWVTINNLTPPTDSASYTADTDYVPEAATVSFRIHDANGIVSDTIDITIVLCP